MKKHARPKPLPTTEVYIYSSARCVASASVDTADEGADEDEVATANAASAAAATPTAVSSEPHPPPSLALAGPARPPRLRQYASLLGFSWLAWLSSRPRWYVRCSGFSCRERLSRVALSMPSTRVCCVNLAV